MQFILHVSKCAFYRFYTKLYMTNITCISYCVHCTFFSSSHCCWPCSNFSSMFCFSKTAVPFSFNRLPTRSSVSYNNRTQKSDPKILNWPNFYMYIIPYETNSCAYHQFELEVLFFHQHGAHIVLQVERALGFVELHLELPDLLVKLVPHALFLALHGRH